ncbi:protein phosphatase 2C domain-containing protein [Paenibacillus sp. MBLB4367]|uniref:protein phosphatase 2C domain-containing protein n=1 Tax=Paenibacillus sp. MBLB4367 TaxID=3384767 RepID=UPI003907EA58
MRIEQLTIRGTSEWNEDALIVNEKLQLYGVADGATSLTPFRGPNQETSGYLASNTVKAYLEALKEEAAAGCRLEEAVLEANDLLKREMESFGIDTADKKAVWSAGIALVRVGEKHIEYVQAGDCMIYAVYKDGSVRTVSRDQVGHIDAKTKGLLVQGIERGITSQAELRKLVSPAILANKNTMNTFDGYAIMNGEKELADHLEFGRINRIQLESLLLITDGLFPPQESEAGHFDPHALIAQMTERTLQGYAESLLALEASDSECQKYPRFKTSDDKTAIWIHFT